MKDSPLSRRRKPKLKLICRFNGTFQQRPPSGKLRYTCGEARIISVDRNIGFSTLKARILELINKCLHFSLLYHLTGNSESTEQSPLVLIASDGDVQRMIDEYEKLEFQGKLCRLWIFVCSDFGFVSLLNKDNGFMKFRETEGISSGSGVLCRKNCFGVNKNGTFLCENGFVNQFSLTHLFGGHGGDNKVKKFVTNGDKVKSSENSLRKMVLKQQLLAKQSARVRRYRGGQGLTIEQSHQLETPSSDSGKNAHDLVDLRYVPESLLSSGSRNHSFVGRSDRGNILDYKYNNTNFVKSENFANSVTLTASHSHPLNPKDGNTCLGLSNSMHSSSGKANENLGNSCGTSSCNSSQSIVVLPFPKADSLISCYDAKCESDSVELASLGNMNRAIIMPSGGDSITIRSGLATTCCNQLVGGVCSARPSYGSSHDGIHNHRLGASHSRKKRISPYHFRNHRSNLTDMGNLQNLKLGQSPWAGKIYPGPWYSSSISKQVKVMRSLNPTSSMPRSDSYHQQVEEEATTTEYILNSETCLFSQSYDSQEKLSEQGSIGVPQDGKQNPNECHTSYYDPYPGMADESLPSLNSTQNSSACTTVLNSQTDLLTGPGNGQHEVSWRNLCQYLPEIGEGFSKHQTCNHALEGGIASSVDFTLQNLTLSSCEDVEPPTPSSGNDISHALLKPRSTALHLMDGENFSSGPQVQDSSEVASVSSFDKVLKLQKDKDQEAGVQRDLESPTSIGEKEEIKKTRKGSKVNGGMPTELAAVCAHLPTRELQTIKNSDLEYIRELGSGTYGTVFYGKWKGSDVAIKKLKPSCFNGDGGAVEEDRLVADFWKEAHMLGQLHHPNIVALYGVVTDGPVTNLATVTEYMVNGSLKQVLRRKDRTIDRRKRVIIAMDAAFGMEYLHEKNIVHFDLKSHNFLVNMRDPQRPVCKIGDLGLSKIKRKTLVSGGVRGTIPWMAPELLNSKNMVTEKVDVYSFGIVMWELLTGEEPYANMRSHEIIAGIIKGTLQPETQSWCDPAWRSLMEKCWSLDPDARPSFSEIAKELRAMAAAMNIK